MALNPRAIWLRVQPLAPAILIALCTTLVAWLFAYTTLRHTRPMGLPLDDSYIYMTYAKQFGRGEPFSYFPGGGYSAGSTSVLWPMLLAPFWTLGARGHALVWVSYILCAVLYALTCIGVWRIVQRIADGVAGLLAALALIAIAPFAWTSLSGMEVAFASALLVAMILLLVDQSSAGPPSKRLVAVLAAASLSRPEATLVVVGVVGVAVVQRLRHGERRAALWWATPLVAPLAWVIANRAIAGNFFPNTGVAKSYFYMPGFDWSFWLDTVWNVTGRMLAGLFWSSTSPLVWPKLVAVAWLVGAVRVLRWSRRTQRWLAGALIVGAPWLLLEAVVASSGAWDFQNYRYIAPAFPLLFVTVGVALARFPLVASQRAARAGWIAATSVAVLLFVRAGVPGLRADATLFAQGAMDTNTQVVRIGQFLRAKLPDAFVMFHDAGAIAYYGDGKVYDMLGLVTNHQAHVTNHGPGSRFEFLESLPEDRRPTHFAYYPGWLIGTADLFGPTLLATPLQRAIEKRRFAGDGNMEVLVASWDVMGTGELPLLERAGWRVVDRVDIADLASERAHGWLGDLGRRKHGDRTAKWSFVAREVGPRGLVLDGGRTIRGRTERFAIETDRERPSRLVLRTGGPAAIYNHEPITQPVTIRVFADDREVGTLVVAPPAGPFVELELALPAGARSIRTEASGHYRAFHWFVLQPD